MASKTRADVEGVLANRTSFRIDLHGWDLSRADLSGMRLVADLTGANLSEAKLQKTDFGQSILDRADLTRANLRGADFFEVSLRNAHLAYADLREAKTAFGMFNGADLSFADLRGADMRGYIKAANLHGAMYDQSTWWPDGFDPIAAGARRV